MSYERRRNALIRLGAPPCESCGRPSTDRELVGAHQRFLPHGRKYGQAQEGDNAIVVAQCCSACRAAIKQNQELERDERRRQMQYEQQQHEIRMHQIRMERARANPEYVRGCLQMQYEMKDILGHY